MHINTYLFLIVLKVSTTTKVVQEMKESIEEIEKESSSIEDKQNNLETNKILLKEEGERILERKK